MEKKKTGYLMAKPNDSKASLGDYNSPFQYYMARAQKAHPKLFPAVVPIKDYSPQRPLRRGATTEAENSYVDTVAIKLTNRWMKEEADR